MVKQVKLAKAIHAELTARAGVPPVVHNGHLCVYAPERGIFVPQDPEAVRRLIFSYDGRRLNGEKGAAWLSDGDGQGILKTLLTLSSLTALPARPGVAFADVFLGVDAGGQPEARAHSPDNGAVYGLSHRWSKKPPKGFWHSALHERVWRDDPEREQKAAALGEFVGACLFGIVTGYKRAVFLYGSVGDNGKSTVLDGIRLLFDNPPTVEPHLIGNEGANAQLAFARINTVAEMRAEDFPNPEQMKAAIAGDPLRARYLYFNPFTFRPSCGHLLAGNNLPQCRDLSNAFWNRWILLACNRTIPPEERLPPVELGAELRKAAPEIAHWAVDGAIRLLRQKAYTVVPSSSTALASWRRKSDQFTQFMDEETEPGDGVALRTIYERYSGWAQQVGHRRMSRSTFEERLRARGLDLRALRMKFRPDEVILQEGTDE